MQKKADTTTTTPTADTEVQEIPSPSVENKNINKENRKYKSQEKDNTSEGSGHSRTLHLVERRKKRLSTDPNQRTRDVTSSKLDYDSEPEFVRNDDDKNNIDTGDNSKLRRSAISVSREERLKKSQTWCVDSSEPVPPPRKKSQRRKVTDSSTSSESGSASKTLRQEPSHTPDSSFDSAASSPKRPPRKTSPFKKTSTPASGTPSSCPTSPIVRESLRKISSKEGVSASSESLPVAPPRPKRSSKRVKSPVSTGSDDIGKDISVVADFSSHCQSRRTESNENNTSDQFQTNEVQLTREIEALFDDIGKKPFVSDISENSVDSTAKEPKAVWKTPTSDYCSQSDGSLVEDEMEAAARKQELEKLKDLYFGKKSSDHVNEECSLELDENKVVQVSTAEVSVESFSTFPLNQAGASSINNSESRSDTGSKRDSGFLEDVFSSINFEVDPFQPQESEPSKISLDLDAYHSEFETSLDKNNKSKIFETSSESLSFEQQSGNYENSSNCVFSDGDHFNQSTSQATDSLINIGYDTTDTTTPANRTVSNNGTSIINDGIDSDISDPATHFKAEFDPFGSIGTTSENTVLPELLQESDVTLISYSKFDNNNADLSHKEIVTDPAKNVQQDKWTTDFNIDTSDSWKQGDLDQNETSAGWIIEQKNLEAGDNTISEKEEMDVEVTPPLPSQPPPPLPETAPPTDTAPAPPTHSTPAPVTSLRSALKQENHNDVLMTSSGPLSGVNSTAQQTKQETDRTEGRAVFGQEPSHVKGEVNNEISLQPLKSQEQSGHQDTKLITDSGSTEDGNEETVELVHDNIVNEELINLRDQPTSTAPPTNTTSSVELDSLGDHKSGKEVCNV